MDGGDDEDNGDAGDSDDDAEGDAEDMYITSCDDHGDQGNGSDSEAFKTE